MAYVMANVEGVSMSETRLSDLTEYATGEYVENDSHVPTTEAIRATYATDYYMVEVGGRGTPEGRVAAFDRWLTQIRARAWDEGYERGVSDEGIDEREPSAISGEPNTVNPYAADRSE